MGRYISVLYVKYNKYIYNENQYADPFTFRLKGVYIFGGDRKKAHWKKAHRKKAHRKKAHMYISAWEKSALGILQ